MNERRSPGPFKSFNRSFTVLSFIGFVRVESFIGASENGDFDRSNGGDSYETGDIPKNVVNKLQKSCKGKVKRGGKDVRTRSAGIAREDPSLKLFVFNMIEKPSWNVQIVMGLTRIHRARAVVDSAG
jgi:hypothetical protein